MDFLQNNMTEIIVILGAIYPPLLFLLPAKYATKIDLGVKIIKAVADGLNRAKDTKGGFSNALEDSFVSNKKYFQKSKS